QLPIARAGAVRWGLALLVCATIQAGAAEPRRVLLLHSYGPDFSSSAETAARVRAELFEQSPVPIHLYAVSLFTARFDTPQEAPAASFGRRPTALFSPTPMLITAAAGSDVRFPELSAWQRYRWQIILIGVVLLLQTALIVGLLYERRQRR